MHVLCWEANNVGTSLKRKFITLVVVRVEQELQKLKRKITNTVQVLTHLKEKLQFVQAENQVEKSQLQEIEELVARVRPSKLFHFRSWIFFIYLFI